MNELSTNKNVEVAIEKVNSIKAHMIQSGNEISAIVYGIKDELQVRNACKCFSEKTGMSKASISKMLMAETLRGKIGINENVSYNAIYKVKDLFSISSEVTEIVANSLESGATEKEIRSILTNNTVTETEAEIENIDTDNSEIDTEEYIDTDITSENAEVEAKDIREQILSILSDYYIEKDDLKVIKSLLKSLR